MRIIDRYILRQMAWPFALGLVVFTFLLIVPQLMQYAEEYVSKGVSLWIVGRLILTLLPYPWRSRSRCRCCWRCWWRSAGCRLTESSSHFKPVE